MIDKSPITRRFVRTRTIQYLYAFHINQQANYQNTLEEIKAAFIPDVFAKEPVDVKQLEKDKHKALDLFTAWESGKMPYVTHATDRTIAHEAASKLWKGYQLKLSQETNILKGGFQATLDKILDAYLLTLQLVIKWSVMAQSQAQKNKQLATNLPYPVELAHNHMLEVLNANDTFLELMVQRHTSWNQHMDVVSRWYNQFIKEAYLFHDPLPTNMASRDKKILEIILQQVVFEEEDIKNFFGSLDLGWVEDEPIVKKLLTNLDIDSLLITIKNLTQLGASSAIFYKQLIENALDQDRSIETLIQQHTPNWSIERIVLLDRLIIKLALCEMRYLPDTPVKVIINEYVDIAKKYSTLKSGAFVNGILDTIAKTV